ncbi:hypothetical protein [Moraxella sp. RCAD0137]|uniref:hypothetical protein n=1 Tax=Moraxella sp. RCAD0137 TaxID=1775913 RepID=UPI000C9F8DD9|nr:hypothetical protein [Moraxella sp. RCAD0137]PNP97739.1 hypothetical protein AZ602_06090 [Moraxella sp. RCAD0137]
MKKLTLKTVIALTMIGWSVVANAVPNVWTGGTQHGYYNSKIENDKKQTLSLSCDVANGSGHGAYFYSKEFPGEFGFGIGINEYDLTFLIDEEEVLSDYDLNQDYDGFFSDIISAKEIKVYKDNQLIGKFNPTEKSRRAHLSRFEKNCQPEEW